MKFSEWPGAFAAGLLGRLGKLCAATVSLGERFAIGLIGARQSGARDPADTEFLPAALEIVETPPSPVGRAVGATVIVLFVAALAWACIGRIDIIATAPGRIVASGGTKLVQPFETGIVKAIHVQDGQRVAAGDLLVELDSTISVAERTHLRDDLIAVRVDVARLRAALSESDDPLRSFDPPKEANATLLETQRQLLVTQIGEQNAKLLALDRQRAQREAERATVAATIDKLETTIPYIQQRVDIRKSLSDKELGSKLVYLETIQQLHESRYELIVQRKRYEEASAALASMIEKRAEAVAEYRRTRATELAEAERKAVGLREDLVKAEQKANLQTLVAPVDGEVQQLAIHTIGGVVTPAQALMTIVPRSSRLEIEASVRNRDIGFVSEGARAEIKIDTFNFTRYGLRHGKVLSVSRDAIMRDRPQDKANDQARGSSHASSEPSGQELIYSARVSIDKTQIQVDDNVVNLTPGMAVTVEISTGSRTVISYLLSPLARYAHESLRER